MDSSKDQPKVAVQFKKGDRVKIKTGAFENTDAVIEEVHADKGTAGRVGQLLRSADADESRLLGSRTNLR